MIRPAEMGDIPALLEMGRAFFAASGFADIGFDDASTVATFETLIKDPNGVLLVAENDGLCGAAAALVYPFYFNANHLTAQELFWWVEPRARQSRVGVELLERLENEVRSLGVGSLTMVALDALDGPRVVELYCRYGYSASERSFLKVF